MSIVTTISPFIISNSIALDALLNDRVEFVPGEGIAVSYKCWKDWVYAAWLRHDSGRPWHIFEMRWKKFSQRSSSLLLQALDYLGEEYLCIRNKDLYVKDTEVFARWQNLRSRMSTLPVKFRILHQADLHLREPLAHPHSSCMAEYISRVGLNECHLHLHACMTPERSWLLSLHNLTLYEHQVMKIGPDKLRPLYMAVHPELTVEKMLNRMRFARYLRSELLSIDGENDVKAVVANMWEKYKSFVRNPVFNEPIGIESSTCNDMENFESQEENLWNDLFSRSEDQSPCNRSLLFFAHLYLLIQNDYLQLCRMNESNKGFDAFQVRAHYSCLGNSLLIYYKWAFGQILKNASDSDSNCMEVRIAPHSFRRSGERLTRIWRACCKERRKGFPRLILTIHFLKRLESPDYACDGEVKVERYSWSRKRLKTECRELIKYMDSLRPRCDIGISIDGAGNELQFPPDVMAPVFREFERETGISYKTYHCGEDYYHLISGIRAVYEGVKFLGLKQGNRIGHATAIGISPKVWRKEIPGLVVMRQGDWLLDLIFIWKLLSESYHRDVLRIEQVMLPVAMKIFGDALSNEGGGAHSLSAFYDARELDSTCLDAGITLLSDEGTSFHPEMRRVIEFRKERGICGVRLFRYWLQDRDSIDEQNRLVEVQRDFLDTDTLLLLQQKVQHIINERNIVLESLPVSNVRISQYQDMRQHHILRWMGVPGHTFPGDEVMTVCIGSDDPGIFVSDIKNEFYHIFANLREAGLTPDECMKYIKRLNHAGRVYSFREKIPQGASYEFTGWPTVDETIESEPDWF